MGYYTYDYLPDLASGRMTTAQVATFSDNVVVPFPGYESQFFYYSSQKYAILSDTFSFSGQAGATYQFMSSSYFDPFILEVFDASGNVIAIDDGKGSYGYDWTSFVAPYSGTYYVSASWDQGAASSHLGVSLSIWQDLDTIGAPTRYWYGTAQNDIMSGTVENDRIDGGAGFDILKISGSRSQYTLRTTSDGQLKITNLSNPGEVDTVSGFEQIHFADRVLSFETTGAAAQAYRLYQAAFDRKPDLSGLGFWISHMEHGTTLRAVAEGFTAAPEFVALYGIKPSDETLVTAMYKNVLHRAPEAEGLAFWLNAMTAGHVDVAGMLVAFSESNENQAQIIGALTAGYEYTPLATA